jgi:hypothetical protein
MRVHRRSRGDRSPHTRTGSDAVPALRRDRCAPPNDAYGDEDLARDLQVLVDLGLIELRGDGDGDVRATALWHDDE